MPVVSVETLAVRVPRAPVLGVTELMVWTSVRSTSVKVSVPVSVRSPVAVTSSVTSPVTSAAETTGASLVPVMVTETSWLSLAVREELSWALMVYVRTKVSPLGRKSKAEAVPELKVQVMLWSSPSALMRPALTDIIALSAVLVRFSGLVPLNVPPTDTDETDAVISSSISESTTVRVPVAVRISSLIDVAALSSEGLGGVDS